MNWKSTLQYKPRHKDAYVLIAGFFCLFLALSYLGIAPGGNDDAEHIKMAQDPTYTSTYAPLFRLISPFFVVQPGHWNFFILFLLCVLPPLLIFRITGEPLSVFFYYATTSFFYSFYIGLYTQLLCFIFVLGILATKNNYARLGLALLGAISHTQGPYLMAFTLFVVFLNDRANDKAALAIGGCSPFWGKQVPVAVNQVVYSSPSGYSGNALTTNNFLSLFSKVTPAPFLFIAAREFWRRKRLDLAALLLAGLLGAAYYGARVWLLAALIMVIGFSWAWPKLKHKEFWAPFVLFYFLFQFGQFISGAILC